MPGFPQFTGEATVAHMVAWPGLLNFGRLLVDLRLRAPRLLPGLPRARARAHELCLVPWHGLVRMARAGEGLQRGRQLEAGRAHAGARLGSEGRRGRRHL